MFETTMPCLLSCASASSPACQKSLDSERVHAPLLTKAVRLGLHGNQEGFGLLGIIVGLALSATVVGVVYTAYQANQRTSDVSASTQITSDVVQHVLASYANAANFSGLSTQSAEQINVFPRNTMQSGHPVNAWGGAIDLTAVNVAGTAGPGNNNGFALTFEQVARAACASFATTAGRGFHDVKVNNSSVMSGAQVNASAAVALCSQGPTATVQFIEAKASPNGPSLPSLTPCVPPAPQSQAVACPLGQISSVPPYAATGITQTRSWFCNGAYGAPGATPWKTVSDTCVPVCVAPPATLTPQTQTVPDSAACPSGQTGSDTWTQSQIRTQTVTYACATPIGPVTTSPATYSPWVNNGGRVGEVNTCSPTCASRLSAAPWQPNPQSDQQWVSTSAPCPPGQIGSHTWQVQQTHNRSAACANPATATDPVWGAWSSWAPTSATQNDVNTCAPACVAPPPSVTYQNVACPSGQTGTLTQSQTITYSCPAPVGGYVSSAGPWTTTGNTCITSVPPPPVQKYGACLVVSPNGPDVNNVLYDLATNHIVQTAFNTSISLTPSQLAETKITGNFCPDNVLIFYGGYASANALAAGMPSSDYLSEWPPYPDPSYPHGPVW